MLVFRLLLLDHTSCLLSLLWNSLMIDDHIIDWLWQIRCKNTTLCSSRGTIVMVTDLNRNNQTDFVLSSRAFMAMANKGMGVGMLKHGILDVEYKR